MPVSNNWKYNQINHDYTPRHEPQLSSFIHLPPHDWLSYINKNKIATVLSEWYVFSSL
jgi:hypothetical protein